MKTIEYIIVKILYASLRRIPFRYSLILAGILRFLAQHILRYRKNVILDNLRLSFPEKTVEELHPLIKEIYKNFAYLWVEILQSGRLDQDFIKKNFTLHNWEIVEDALAEGKGLLLLTGHLSNFEWPVHYCMLNLDGVYAIMKRLSNPRINKLIMGIRESTGGKMILTKQAIKHGLRVLKQGDCLVVVTDQDAGKTGVFVNFLGRPASTATGAAIFHLKTKAPIVFVAGIRKKYGVFDIYFERIPDYQHENFSDKSIREITKLHTAVLEKWIKRYPEQYLWTHKRWKTKESVSTDNPN